MMVLIVGKTQMRPNIVCVGGWNLDNNTSLRLLTADGRNHTSDTPFNVGDVWELAYHGRSHLDPPHNEDVLVTSTRRIGPQANLTTALRSITNPLRGSIDDLYQGLLQFPGTGTGYITRQTGIPTFSTQFWITDNRFVRNDFDTKIRYKYEGAMIRNVTYKGLENNPPAIIPRGTLVRVSLARWYNYGDGPNPKCYLQLSGWFD